MTLKGIIFDMDGTLADTLPVCIELYVRVFRKRLGREYTSDEITALFGLPEEGIIARCVPQDPQGALADYMVEYTQLHAAVTQPFPGIIDALQQLKQRGLRLGMVTGKGPLSAAVSMEYLGLGPYIDPIVYGDARKPNKPEGMFQVLSTWGIAPDEAAYVGDTPYDMLSAQQAGVIPISAAWAATNTIEIGRANGTVKVFTSVADFLAWVENQN